MMPEAYPLHSPPHLTRIRALASRADGTWHIGIRPGTVPRILPEQWAVPSVYRY